MTLNDDKRLRQEGDDDLPPTGAEAKAQRKATSMPLVWLVIGFVVIALFILATGVGNGLFKSVSGGPAPVKATTSSIEAAGAPSKA